MKYDRFLLTVMVFSLSLGAYAESLMVMKEDYGQFSYNTALQSRIEPLAFEDPMTQEVQSLLERSGLDYQIKLRHWPVAYRRATNRENYALFPLERSAVNAETFEFVGPLTQYNWVIYTRASSEVNIDSLDDLSDMNVGGYENSPFVRHLQNEGIEVSTLPYDALNLKRLVLGYIDAWATYDENAERIAMEASYPLPRAAWTARTVDIYLGVNRASAPATLEAIRRVPID
ncbi:MAG: hypothetical protein ACX931_10625 [Saccharospirillum sp.]